MNIDLKKLKELAMAATPGPWYVQYGDDGHHCCMTAVSPVNDRDGNGGMFGEQPLVAVTFHQRYPYVNMDGEDCGDTNSAYIAAVNPAAILELIALAERAAPAQAEPSVTVDSPEFRNHLLTYWASNESTREISAKHLIAHINTWASAVTAKAVAAKDAEIEALHRRLAGETLRADQGWARYEAANRERIALQMKIADSAAQASVGVPEGWREFVEAVAEESYDCHPQTQEMFCTYCGVSGDNNEDHKPNCMMLRARAFLAAAPAAPQAIIPKPWEQRMDEHYAQGGKAQVRTQVYFQALEIMDWRALNITPQAAQIDLKAVAEAIHYPGCWDTAAYSTLAEAMQAVYAHFKCTDERHTDLQPAQEARDKALEEAAALMESQYQATPTMREIFRRKATAIRALKSGKEE